MSEHDNTQTRTRIKAHADVRAVLNMTTSRDSRDDGRFHHLVFAIDSLVGRGAEKVVVNLGETLVNMGHRVSIVLYEDIIDFDIDSRVRIFRLNPQIRKGSRLFSGLTDAVNVEKFQLLLDQIEHEQGKAALIISALPRMDRILGRIKDERIYHVIHNPLSLQNGVRRKPLLKRLMHIWHVKRLYDGRDLITVSDGVGEDIRRFVNVRPASMRTIYNPFPFEKLRALAAQPFTNNYGDYILHIGAFTIKQKRQDLLIEAFAASGLTCRLVLLGKGRDEADIRSAAQRYGVADRVVLAGFHSNPYPYIKHARMLVLSSDYEGFGNVLVESLVVGTPVLSTDCPAGPAEILQGELANALVPSGDVQALATKMRQSYGYAQTAELAPIERFAAESVARNYLSLIR